MPVTTTARSISSDNNYRQINRKHWLPSQSPLNIMSKQIQQPKMARSMKRMKRSRISRRNINRKLQSHCDIMLKHTSIGEPSPHPMFVVTQSSMGKKWDNTIVVSAPFKEIDEFSKKNGRIYYKTIDFVGLNVQKEWSRSCRKKPFDLHSVPGKTLFIVTPMNQEMLSMGLTFVGRESLNFRDNDKIYYVVLLLSCLASDEKLVEWPESICSILSKTKPNIVKAREKGHFMSSGKCYGFGFGPKYERNEKDERLTIAPYTKLKTGKLKFGP